MIPQRKHPGQGKLQPNTEHKRKTNANRKLTTKLTKTNTNQPTTTDKTEKAAAESVRRGKSPLRTEN